MRENRAGGLGLAPPCGGTVPCTGAGARVRLLGRHRRRRYKTANPSSGTVVLNGGLESGDLRGKIPGCRINCHSRHAQLWACFVSQNDDAMFSRV
jgi:hypothetical protein